MSVKILTDTVKSVIAHQFQFEKRTKPWLAKTHGVSTRTIFRVLQERGLIANTVLANKDEHLKVKKIMSRFNIHSAEELNKRLTDAFTGQAVLGFDSPDIVTVNPMTMESVQVFLNQRTKEELAALFYTSGLIKIAEMHVGSVANATLKHQEAARKADQDNKQLKVNYGKQFNHYKASH